jgi:signal transduction histidine kinase
MRERAEELGGTCLVEALPAGGTRVWARLPLLAEEDATTAGDLLETPAVVGKEAVQ